MLVRKRTLRRSISPPSLSHCTRARRPVARYSPCVPCVLRPPLPYTWTDLFCYTCTRLSITNWYRKPPAVDESMVASFCSGVSAVLGLHLVVAAFGCYAQGTSLIDGLPVYVIAPLVWLAFNLAPLHWCLDGFRPYDEVEMEVLDTNDIPWEDVRTVKRYEMETYVCPKLSKDVVVAAQQALKQFQRLTRIKSGKEEDDDEEANQAPPQQSCCDRMLSSIDDLISNALE